MGLSHTVSEIIGDCSRKLQISPTPVYLSLALRGFRLELRKPDGLKKLE